MSSRLEYGSSLIILFPHCIDSNLVFVKSLLTYTPIMVLIFNSPHTVHLGIGWEIAVVSTFGKQTCCRFAVKVVVN